MIKNKNKKLIMGSILAIMTPSILLCTFTTWKENTQQNTTNINQYSSNSFKPLAIEDDEDWIPTPERKVFNKSLKFQLKLPSAKVGDSNYIGQFGRQNLDLPSNDKNFEGLNVKSIKYTVQHGFKYTGGGWSETFEISGKFNNHQLNETDKLFKTWSYIKFNATQTYAFWAKYNSLTIAPGVKNSQGQYPFSIYHEMGRTHFSHSFWMYINLEVDYAYTMLVNDY